MKSISIKQKQPHMSSSSRIDEENYNNHNDDDDRQRLLDTSITLTQIEDVVDSNHNEKGWSASTLTCIALGMLLTIVLVVHITPRHFITSLATRYNNTNNNDNFTNYDQIIHPSQSLTDYLLRLNSSLSSSSSSSAKSFQFPNWIVITSINFPTNAIYFLLNEMNEWHVVIIADKKSPNKQAYLSQLTLHQQTRLHFLSIEDQLKLGYESVRLIPFAAYTRKNLGYLYAIEHGARIIYETDDDNAPFSKQSLEFMASNLYSQQQQQKWVMTYNVSQSSTSIGDGSGRGLFSRKQSSLQRRLVVNPYAHFGQPTIWPRGYPLERIDFAIDGESSTLDGHLHRDFDYQHSDCTKVQSLIVQGLANGDPDVDAVFRLTRRYERIINITFDASAPPISLPSGILAPFNSQNTLFHYDAFWSLMLPITTNFRVCDIWRGYWTQRLLWEISGQLLFTGPTVFQDRNFHSYLDDFIDEHDLYYDAGRLVRFLVGWKCRFYDLAHAMVQLTYDMAMERFWGFTEVDMVVAWIHDLNRIGYVFPSLSSPPYKSYCVPHKNTKEDNRRAHLELDARPLWKRLENLIQLSQDTVISSPLVVKSLNITTTNTTTVTITTAKKVPKRPLVFWSGDIHDGTRIDHPSFLIAMGHRVFNGGDKRGRSPYPYAIQQQTLVQRVGRPTSGPELQVRESMIREGFEFYKNDPQMKEVDAFTCGFWPPICEYFAMYNRSIIFTPAHRFAIGRCTPASFNRMVEHVQKWAAPPTRPGAPHNIVSAASIYDLEYMEYFTGVKGVYLTSNSFWYAENKTTYLAQPHPTILVGPLQRLFVPFHAELNAAMGRMKVQNSSIETFSFATIKQLHSPYVLQDIANHRAVIMMPYAMISYGITELYALTIPMFVPSKDFLLDLRLVDDWQHTNVHYCPRMTMSQMRPFSNPPLHPYHPEDKSREAVKYWFQFADFYTWPHIITFNSFDHLIQLLATTNFTDIHLKMKEANHVRRNEFINNWQTYVWPLIDDGPTKRLIPQDYNSAIYELWNYTNSYMAE